MPYMTVVRGETGLLHLVVDMKTFPHVTLIDLKCQDSSPLKEEPFKAGAPGLPEPTPPFCPTCFRVSSTMKTDDKAMTAEKRGMEMMRVPMSQLPPLATMFAKHLCAQAGMCMETLLTAWTIYAQCVEGLECTDTLYKARDEDIEWFKNNREVRV